MGCDIHAHIEVKINGKWEHYSTPRIQRWYQLFAKIAGVRNNNDITPISEPKGLPEDISEITKFESDYMGSDGHSHSWLNVKEIKEMLKYIDELDPTNSFEHKELGYIGGNGVGDFEVGEGYPKEYQDVRMVFWFDN